MQHKKGSIIDYIPLPLSREELLLKKLNMIETSNWKKVVSAVLSAALVAGLGWLVTNFANIAFFATHPLIAAATLAGVVSLLKQLGTTDEGKFAGAIPIK